MRSSIEQAVDILKGWMGDKRTVAVLLTSNKDSIVKFGGVIVEVNPVSLRVFGDDFLVEVNLSVATDFDWQDPREGRAELREKAVRVYDSTLEIRSPSYRCLLFAFKVQEEERGA